MEDEVPEWLQAVHEEEAVVLAAPARPPSRSEENGAELRSIEHELLVSGMGVVGGGIDFVHLDPENPTVMPEGWEEEFGFEGARLRLRAAQAGLMSAKEAPVGMKMAMQVVTGIVKARAVEKTGARSLNVAVVKLTIRSPLPYEEVEVDE